MNVKNATVKCLVKDELLNNVGEEDYNLCMNKECKVVYYKFSPYIVFNRHDIKVPVWFKDGASPKYICYCNKVTEEQIIDAVVKKNARDMKDVIKLTGAMKNGQCLVNNPTGKCCGSAIQEILKKALNQ